MNAKMSSKSQSSTKTTTNSVEALKDLGSSIAQNTAKSFKDLGSGMIDQLFGGFAAQEESYEEQIEKLQKPQQKDNQPSLQRERNLFNYQTHHENTVVTEQIKRLVEQIKQEIEYIKKADKALLNEVQDVQKISMESITEKPGVYHIRFLEIVLRTLRLLRAKIGESKTWMQALMSKKKKRGSLFAARSKKSGTQYSLSQELSSSRSVQ